MTNMRALAGKVVELGLVESLSDGPPAAKKKCSRWLKKRCIPKVGGELSMEDVLDLYAEPYEQRPVVCRDLHPVAGRRETAAGKAWEARLYEYPRATCSSPVSLALTWR